MSGFTYSACGSFRKMKERTQKFKETGDSRYIYEKELDQRCFQNDVPCGDFKDLANAITSEKILHDKAFSITKNQMMDINVDLTQWSSSVHVL